MKLIQILIPLLAFCVGSLSISTAAELSAADKQFLARYGKAHDALVADDLGGAKKAGTDLGPDGADLSESKLLDEARAAFAKLSDKAVKLAAGQSGYHVFHCPMLKKDWVQTSTTVANPYGGKAMVSCGEIKK